MRRVSRITFTLILFLVSFYANAQSVSELWDRARVLRDQGQYQEAIEVFERVKDLDSSYSEDCDRLIRQIREMMNNQNVGKDAFFMLSAESIVFPYSGGQEIVELHASGKAAITENAEWLEVVLSDDGTSILISSSPNPQLISRSSIIKVSQGEVDKYIRVQQAEASKYITSPISNLEFASEGGKKVVPVSSNFEWTVIQSPTWCSFDSVGDSLYVIVAMNESLNSRTEEIHIGSWEKEFKIMINQEGKQEVFETSLSFFHFEPEGGECIININSNYPSWSIEDFPTWLNVEKIGDNAIHVVSGKNLPNGEIRSGSIQIRTATQTIGVLIEQSPRYPSDVLFPDSRLVSGRNVSFGLSANYRIPIISAKSGGEYTGSVVDYSLGNREEQAVYRNAVSYGMGVFSDIRLYKNLFILLGADISFTSYQNHFDGTIPIFSPHTSSTYIRAITDNSYREIYRHTFLEVPVLPSWKFKTSSVSSFAFYLGPVISIGLSSRLHLSGTTGASSVSVYDKATHQLLSVDNEGYYTKINDVFDLYSTKVNWNEIYTEAIVDYSKGRYQQFADSPLSRLNCNFKLGCALDLSGLSFGIAYLHMLTNMANEGYWDNSRWGILGEAPITMADYKHRIHYIEFKISYTFKY